MQEPKKRYRMPAWIWKLPPQVLTGEEKRFLAFIWWCGFETCHCHNWYLARKFGFCKRTIQRRLAKLKGMKFIAIGCPGSWMRTIFPRALRNEQQWLAAMAQLKIIPPAAATRYQAARAIVKAHNRRSKKCH